MSISTVKLYYRRSGITYSCNLYTDPADFGGAPYIAVRKTASLYAPLVPVADGRASYLRARRSGVTYAIAWTYSNLPANMIVLYKDAADVPSGGSYFTAAGDNYIMGGASVGVTGGAASHAATDHATLTPTVSGAVVNDVRSSSGGLKYASYTGDSSHTHSIAHVHPNSENNDPPFNKYIAVYGAPCVNPNALILSDLDFTLLSASWTFYDQVKRFMKLGNSVVLGGGDTMIGTHGAFSGNTGNYACGDSVKWEDYSIAPSQTHAHDLSHTHPDGPWGTGPYAAPLYSMLSGYLWTGGAFYTMAEFPIGSIAFFTDATLPAGWSRVSAMDGRLVRGYDVKTTGYDHDGSETHTHQYSGSCPANTGTAGEGWTGTGSGTRKAGAGGHNINHEHSAASWMPPWYTMVIGRRDS